ncbi:DUF5522 domain-containing protein [uncultured Chitinophaga sp.]|uniref:DUF5522 domain-containing protein n=1 Tax=uncultured Chitinophaga sp. TaxID=339340 RepID=UPI00345C3F09
MKTPLIEKIDFYYNEQGLMVLTAKFHLDRGRCCGNGCKHCPYDYENVPENKKAQLLTEREQNQNER